MALSKVEERLKRYFTDFDGKFDAHISHLMEDWTKVSIKFLQLAMAVNISSGLYIVTSLSCSGRYLEPLR